MKNQEDEIVTSPETPTNSQSPEVVPAESNGTLRIGLTFKEQPVKLIRPDGQGGEVEDDCILRQLSGKQRDDYLQMIRNRSKTSPDGKNLIVTDLRGLEGTLLQWSFFRVEKTDTGRKLHQYKLEEIDGWPDESRDVLYAASCKLSKIGDKEDKKDKGDEEGND